MAKPGPNIAEAHSSLNSLLQCTYKKKKRERERERWALNLWEGVRWLCGHSSLTAQLSHAHPSSLLATHPSTRRTCFCHPICPWGGIPIILLFFLSKWNPILSAQGELTNERKPVYPNVNRIK
jgi:hypothetical protein